MWETNRQNQMDRSTDSQVETMKCIDMRNKSGDWLTGRQVDRSTSRQVDRETGNHHRAFFIHAFIKI